MQIFASRRVTAPALKLLAADVDSGYKRIQFSQQAKNLAEKNLRMQEKRFQVGLLERLRVEAGNENAEGRCQPSALLK